MHVVVSCLLFCLNGMLMLCGSSVRLKCILCACPVVFGLCVSEPVVFDSPELVEFILQVYLLSPLWAV